MTRDAELCDLGTVDIPWAVQIENWLGSVKVSNQGLDQLKRPIVGIVSSHLSQTAFATESWQNALLSALSFARRENAAVLFAMDTPYASAIRNACSRTKSAYIEVTSIPVSTSTTKSFDSPKQSDSTTIQSVNHLIVHRYADTNLAKLNALPFLDRFVFALSSYLFVLDINPTGKIAKLVDLRLDAKEFPVGSLFLAYSVPAYSVPAVHSVPVQPISRSATRKLDWIRDRMGRGAVGWSICTSNTERPRNENVSCLCKRSPPYTVAPILSYEHLVSSTGNYLIHCTRARQGAWPDQSAAQFYDEFLIQPWQQSPTAFQSLQRILETKRIVATSHLKTGAVPTISFTAREISELLAARSFESHLARWDWEPYGLMVSKRWLEAAGCRPVLYRKRNELRDLDPEELIFAQPYDDTQLSGKKGRDWRVEKEWRLPQDLRLHQVPFSQAMVFVKSRWQAKQLAPVSNWPICYIDP
ncbi:hypothetical protein SH449x_003976 [Pirellulaceae bacterium SH449]